MEVESYFLATKSCTKNKKSASPKYVLKSDLDFITESTTFESYFSEDFPVASSPRKSIFEIIAESEINK